MTYSAKISYHKGQSEKEYTKERYNGFYSLCKFNDYTHEVTIGSTDTDNDMIGIVIAAFKDDLGFQNRYLRYINKE